MTPRHLLALASLLPLLGCDEPAAPAPPSTAAAARPLAGDDCCPPPATPAAALPGDSLYHLPVALRSSDGAVVGLDAFRGHPVVVSMFYGSCAYACPRLMQDVLRLEGGLSEATRARTRVLLISFDPARDTPDALGRLKKGLGVDPARWLFAGADDPQTREVAALLGIRYRQQSNGDFNHSSIITILDGEGRVALQVDGLGRPMEEAVAVLERLAAGAAP